MMKIVKAHNILKGFLSINKFSCANILFLKIRSPKALKLVRNGNFSILKVSNGAKIRNRYNQVPHLTQDTNGKVTTHSRHHKREPRGQPFPSR